MPLGLAFNEGLGAAVLAMHSKTHEPQGWFGKTRIDFADMAALLLYTASLRFADARARTVAPARESGILRVNTDELLPTRAHYAFKCGRDSALKTWPERDCSLVCKALAGNELLRFPG